MATAPTLDFLLKEGVAATDEQPPLATLPLRQFVATHAALFNLPAKELFSGYTVTVERAADARSPGTLAQPAAPALDEPLAAVVGNTPAAVELTSYYRSASPEEQLRLAHVDPTTGGLNAYAFVAKARDPAKPLVAQVRIGGVKDANDNFSHDLTDRLFATVARELYAAGATDVAKAGVDLYYSTNPEHAAVVFAAVQAKLPAWLSANLSQHFGEAVDPGPHWNDRFRASINAIDEAHNAVIEQARQAKQFPERRSEAFRFAYGIGRPLAFAQDLDRSQIPAHMDAVGAAAKAEALLAAAREGGDNKLLEQARGAAHVARAAVRDAEAAVERPGRDRFRAEVEKLSGERIKTIEIPQDLRGAHASAHPKDVLERAFIDSTTGQLNKNGFDLLDEREWKMSLDIARFRELNDTAGRELGDEILKRLANLMSQYHGDELCAARVGGDEFRFMAHDRETLEEFKRAIQTFTADVGYKIRDVETNEIVFVDSLMVPAGIAKTWEVADGYELERDKEAHLDRGLGTEAWAAESFRRRSYQQPEEIPDSRSNVPGRADLEAPRVRRHHFGDPTLSREEVARRFALERQLVDKAHPSDPSSPAAPPPTRERLDELEAANARGAAVAAATKRFLQSAWHGSPHRDLESFSLAHVGTGEGHQAYGWGMYFAADKKVAEMYRSNLQQGPRALLDGREVAPNDDRVSPAERAIVNYVQQLANVFGRTKPLTDPTVLPKCVDVARDTLAGRIDAAEAVAAGKPGDWRPRARHDAERIPELREQLRALERFTSRLELREGGQVYKVEVPDDDKLLHRDETLARQPPAVRQALAGGADELAATAHAKGMADDDVAFALTFLRDDARGAATYEAIGHLLSGTLGSERPDAARLASEWLAARGVPGARYHDPTAPLRDRSAFNYVIWSETAVHVVDRLYQPAWHGSPNRNIDRFSLESVGSGEGHQAYGYGLYFAANKSVADFYRATLAPRPTLLVDGHPSPELSREELRESYRDPVKCVITRLHDKAQALVGPQRQSPDLDPKELLADVITDLHTNLRDSNRSLERALEAASGDPLATRVRTHTALVDQLAEQLRIAQDLVAHDLELQYQGQTYKVEVPDDTELLDYDRPMSEQPPAVLAKLAVAGLRPLGPPSLGHLAERQAHLEDLARAHERELASLKASHPSPGKPSAAERLVLDNGTPADARDALLEKIAAVERQSALGEAGVLVAHYEVRLADLNRTLVELDAHDHASLHRWANAYRAADARVTALTSEYNTILVQLRETVLSRNGRDLTSGAAFYQSLGSPRVASAKLLAAGVPGLRYLDGASRADWQGSHNYVVWDEQAVKILDRLYQPEREEELARGWVDIVRKDGAKAFNIFLAPDADPSTLLHEQAHVFLEMLGDLADRPDAPAQVRDDFAAALQWLGVADRADLRTEHHEQWARGFEAFFLEGKAPTPALQQAFEAFKAWLTEIYRAVASLNVELNDNIRRVYSNMLDVASTPARDTSAPALELDATREAELALRAAGFEVVLPPSLAEDSPARLYQPPATARAGSQRQLLGERPASAGRPQPVVCRGDGPDLLLLVQQLALAEAREDTTRERWHSVVLRTPDIARAVMAGAGPADARAAMVEARAGARDRLEVQHSLDEAARITRAPIPSPAVAGDPLVALRQAEARFAQARAAWQNFRDRQDQVPVLAARFGLGPNAGLFRQYYETRALLSATLERAQNTLDPVLARTGAVRQRIAEPPIRHYQPQQQSSEDKPMPRDNDRTPEHPNLEAFLAWAAPHAARVAARVDVIRAGALDGSITPANAAKQPDEGVDLIATLRVAFLAERGTPVADIGQAPRLHEPASRPPSAPYLQDLTSAALDALSYLATDWVADGVQSQDEARDEVAYLWKNRVDRNTHLLRPEWANALVDDHLQLIAKQPPDYYLIDRAAADAIEKAHLQPTFEAWVQDKLAPVFAELQLTTPFPDGAEMHDLHLTKAQDDHGAIADALHVSRLLTKYELADERAQARWQSILLDAPATARAALLGDGTQGAATDFLNNATRAHNTLLDCESAFSKFLPHETRHPSGPPPEHSTPDALRTAASALASATAAWSTFRETAHALELLAARRGETPHRLLYDAYLDAASRYDAVRIALQNTYRDTPLLQHPSDAPHRFAPPLSDFHVALAEAEDHDATHGAAWRALLLRKPELVIAATEGRGEAVPALREANKALRERIQAEGQLAKAYDATLAKPRDAFRPPSLSPAQRLALAEQRLEGAHRAWKEFRDPLLATATDQDRELVAQGRLGAGPGAKLHAEFREARAHAQDAARDLQIHHELERPAPQRGLERGR